MRKSAHQCVSTSQVQQERLIASECDIEGYKKFSLISDSRRSLSAVRSCTTHGPNYQVRLGFLLLHFANKSTAMHRSHQ